MHPIRRFGRVFRSAVVAVLVASACDAATSAADEGPTTAAPASRERAQRPAETPTPDTKAETEAKVSAETSHRLPADSVTKHTIALPGRNLSFRATAGALHLNDAQGVAQADIAFVAYQLDGVDSRARPLAFALNGGPGTASGWLQLGALGPWRLPMNGDAVSPSAPPALVDNADTWLDFTDLVFIDPAGTGYSRIVASGEQVRKKFWSIDGDITSIAGAMRQWLEANDRLASPKFIIGESYGGFRGPKLVRELQRDQGIGIQGVILISPVLDFGLSSGLSSPFRWLVHLPSYAAVAREAAGPLGVDQLADVEQYARGEYLTDFLRGERDVESVARMSARVATLIGLEPALVRQYGGRIDVSTFRREFDRRHGRITSAYDATVTGFDPFTLSSSSRYADPLTDALEAPVTLAMTDLVTRRLGWKVDGWYVLTNRVVNRAWDWGRGDAEAVSDLRSTLAFDPRFRALVSHGLTDLVTPYFASKLILEQIPDFGPPGRLQLKVYGGGHMHYTRDESRRALREDARQLIEDK